QKAARKERLPIALVGGFAMRYYGSPRLTDDVDVAAPRVPSFAIGLPFPKGGVRYWTPKGLEVNVIVRDDASAALYADAVKQAKRTRWGFRVVTPEHLAAMKLESSRAEPDVGDLKWLVRKPRLVNRPK